MYYYSKFLNFKFQFTAHYFSYICGRFSKMELKRKISLFFVFVAMVAVLGHALIPHCHHADGVYIMANGHHHHCHHYSSDGTLQICANDHDDEVQEDCLSEKSFLKTSSTEQIHNYCVYALLAMQSLEPIVPNADESGTVLQRVPFNIVTYYVAWLYGSGGLRAPPAQA